MPSSRNWTVQEKHGILDTEWTVQFTELLKIELINTLTVKLKILNCRSLAQNLDKLTKVDLERAAC